MPIMTGLSGNEINRRRGAVGGGQCGGGHRNAHHAIPRRPRDADDGHGLPQHGPARARCAEPITSDLTCQEMWNLTNMGYMPVKLVLGTAVYSLGVLGGLKAMFKSFVRGEISDLTSLIYDAREHAIGLITDEAKAIGADDVVGIRTHIHELGTLIEFMAIGTAVKRVSGLSTATPTLPPQAIIEDKDTWISSDSAGATAAKMEKAGQPNS